MNYHLFEDDSIKVNMVFEEFEIERFIEMWEDGYGIEKNFLCIESHTVRNWFTCNGQS